MPRSPDPLAGNYHLKCTYPGCHGTSIVEMNFGLGWRIEQLIPEDPSEPARARCPQCKRHKMKVISVPPGPPLPGPKGFRHVPEK